MRLVAVLAAGGCVPAGAQSGKGKPPERFTEALVYARFARESFSCETISESKLTDPVNEAIKWSKQAIAMGRKFKTADKQRMLRLKDFLRRQESDLEFYKKVDEQLDRAAKKVEPALSYGELDKAAALLPADGPKCDPRLQRLTALVEEKRKLFQTLVAQGDRLGRFDKARALERYRSAASIDRQDKDLARKIRDLERK
ncbi:MAG: hypothetical protein U0Q16_25805 [Bryobacteraceae bacterium]